MKKPFFGPARVLLCVCICWQTGLSPGGLQRRVDERPQLGGVIRIKAFTNVFNPDLDPAGDSYQFIIEHLYDGLVRLDKNFNPVPALADYWWVSDDGQRMVFYLRKGVKFHHGRELTADDVKFSLERLVQKKTGSPYYQYFTGKVVGADEYRQGKAESVAGFKAPDRSTFEIQWKRPYVSGLYLLSMNFCKILPRDLLQSQGKEFFLKPVGTGAFRFGYWVRSPRLDRVGVRLERNEDYFGDAPYLDAVEFSPYYTLDQFLDNDVHIIPFLSDRLAGGRYQVLENDSLHTTFLGMSCHLPPLDRPAVRRAIALGLDKRKLAQAAYSPDLVPLVTDNFIPPRLPGFLPVESGETNNPEKAKEILLQEGFSEANPFPRLNLFVEQPKKDFHGRFERELRNQLRVLGIPVQMEYLKSPDEPKTQRKPYLTLVEWVMGYPDAENVILPLFHSGSIVNELSCRYRNPLLDKLLAASEVEKSWERRIGLFRKMEQILLGELPSIPLYTVKMRMALQPYVRGAKVPPLGFYSLDAKDLWLER